MGNRVRIQMKSGNELSPVIYGHWSGSGAAEAVLACRNQMEGRVDDVPYAAARMVQNLIGADGGNTGFGIWNQEKELTAAAAEDAGCYVIDVSRSKWVVTIKGGHPGERGAVVDDPGRVEFQYEA